MASDFRNTKAARHSTDDEDNSDDNLPVWKERKGKDMETDVQRAESKPAENRPSITQNKKKNNIWGSVLTEQDLTESMVHSAAVDRPSELSYNERSVESYDFTKKYHDFRPDLDDNEDLTKPEIKHDPFEMVVSGTSTVPSRTRPLIDYEDVRPKSNIDRGRDTARQNRKRKAEGSNDRQQKGSVHDRLGVKKVTTTRLGEIDVTEDMDNNEVSKKIADFLHEAKTELIERVVEHLGKAAAIRILQATKDVEETGGMYTADGSRRRTPGGVYLFLLKKQPEFNPKVKKLIFQEEEEEKKKLKKERNKRAKARKSKKKFTTSGNSRSRSNSSSRSRSRSVKEEHISEEEMEDDRVKVKKEFDPVPTKKEYNVEEMEDDRGKVKKEFDPTPVKKEDNKEEEMEDDRVRVKKEFDAVPKMERGKQDRSGRFQNKCPSRSRNRHRGRKRLEDSNSEETASSDSEETESSEDERQMSNRSKPFSFEDELAKAKELILQKSKSNTSNKDRMEAESEAAVSATKSKGSVSEMGDLESAEASVVDIDFC